MAMAQFAGSSSGSAPAASAAAAPSAGARSEIQLLLSKFDVMINQMQDYPAKDTINALTMLAERVQFAPDVVSFLETKIHRVRPMRVPAYRPFVLEPRPVRPRDGRGRFPPSSRRRQARARRRTPTDAPETERIDVQAAVGRGRQAVALAANEIVDFYVLGGAPTWHERTRPANAFCHFVVS